jgi:murein L,D-transpeptidase YcbB/YkuD
MFTRLSRAFIIAVALPLMVVTAALASAAQVQEAIKSRVESLKAKGELSIDGARIASRKVLPELYEASGFNLLWQNTSNVKSLMAEIESIEGDGLLPRNYHASQLQALQSQTKDPAKKADFDLLLTDAVIRLAYHLVFGKVDPEALDSNWNLSFVIDDANPNKFFKNLIGSKSFAKELNALRPPIPYYDEARSALKHYRKIQEAGGWEPVPEGAALKKGMTDPRVTDLRSRLIVTGDLEEAAAGSQVFDDHLEEAVKRFQERHRLEADGVVGKGTLEALNVPVESRIDQIRVNLERARWVFHKIKGKFVAVNIAGFKVYLQDEGKNLWTSRVQVGRTYRKTPVFKSKIQYLEFNPTWTIPPGILRKDTLPAAKKDPNYLSSKNIRVIDSQGKTVNPASIDWSKYPQQRFPYTLRQDPGPGNALGLVKFMFPNKHLVYLHDTPSKQHFERKDRAFSSGCIRVQKPFELAELLLNDPVKWNRDEIMKVIESKKTQRVNLPEPVPVMLLYWTFEVDDDGRFKFKKDLYKRDQAILKGLNGGFKFRKRPLGDGKTL